MQKTNSPSSSQVLKLLLMVGVLCFSGFALSDRQYTKGSINVSPMWQAEQGLAYNARAQKLIERLENSPRCAGSDQFGLSDQRPVGAFRVTLGNEWWGKDGLVIFQRAAINEIFAVLVEDRQGCYWYGQAGRNLEFNQRAHMSMYPNLALPVVGPYTQITVFLQDGKSLNPWIGLQDYRAFRTMNTRTWILFGLYLGMLSVYAVVGFGFAIWQRSWVSISYSLYVSLVILWFLQNFGLGSAFIPWWPDYQHFPTLQGVATAFVVIGISIVCVTFLRLKGWLLSIIALASASSAGFFMFSGIYENGYRSGAIALAVLSLTVIGITLSRIRIRARSEQLFLIGLVATLIGGAVQSVSVFTGSDYGGFAIYAFPLGNFVESTFWLMAIAIRLRGEHRRLQLKLIFDATHDSLTRLPNRSHLESELQSSILLMQENKSNRSLLFVDLDRFKNINDSLGHGTGDKVLKRVSEILRQELGPVPFIARFGGDEFCIIVEDDVKGQYSMRLSEKIIQSISRPMQIGDRELYLSASVGICEIKPHYEDADTVLRDADLALFNAKKSGRKAFARFDEALFTKTQKRFLLEHDMLPGIKREEFYLEYQPILSLQTQQLLGFEALVRWNHPQYGVLQPETFISMAEEVGAIRLLGEEVLRQGIGQLGEWKRQNLWHDELYLSINVSGIQLYDLDLALVIDALLKQNNVAPQELRLEITETALVANNDVAQRNLPRLKRRGLLLAVDDFGVGYSSLSYLHEHPFDILKIDRSFVTDIHTNLDKKLVVKSMIAMARELHLDVIAEGIETEEQADLLKSMGCVAGQGFYLSKPLPLNEASNSLRSAL